MKLDLRDFSRHAFNGVSQVKQTVRQVDHKKASAAVQGQFHASGRL